jgi:hypothetical protein
MHTQMQPSPTLVRGAPRWLAAVATPLLLLALAPGCASDVCPACADPEHRGMVESPALNELSGLAASNRHADVFYGHNDSGDSSRIFALSSTGAHLATFDLQDARNDDWEDIARAPCAAGECLWVADIGDNDGTRTEYAIYLMEEPATIEPGDHIVPSDRVRFTYPDGSHDAEVLLVHPRTGEVAIVTKVEEGPASIYTLPSLVPNAMLEAVKVGEVDPPAGRSKFTGGAVHPDATGILLRTKSRLFHWPMAPEQTVAEALAGVGCQLPLADEVQGEAVAWLPDGDGFVTIGEGPHPAINVASCGG